MVRYGAAAEFLPTQRNAFFFAAIFRESFSARHPRTSVTRPKQAKAWHGEISRVRSATTLPHTRASSTVSRNQLSVRATTAACTANEIRRSRRARRSANALRMLCRRTARRPGRQSQRGSYPSRSSCDAEGCDDTRCSRVTIIKQVGSIRSCALFAWSIASRRGRGVFRSAKDPGTVIDSVVSNHSVEEPRGGYMNRLRSCWVWLGGVAILSACSFAAEPTEPSEGTGDLTVGPRLCAPAQCGPGLGIPNYLCPDGVTLAGPSGRCLRGTNGGCGWEVVACATKACASSSECSVGEYCTTSTGVCNPAPGCGAGRACIQLCYGTCVTNATAVGASSEMHLGGGSDTPPSSRPDLGLQQLSHRMKSDSN